MSSVEDTLRSINAPSILDVATGRGDFILLLLENLGSAGSAIGVDIKKSDIWASEEFNRRKVKFDEMDAVDLKYKDETFDLVSISNSLHHMQNPEKVLSEMVRVLKPGGTIILYEMYTDKQTPSQQTHTFLHQWWAKIDTAAGNYHNSPYQRCELINYLKATGITNWQFFDEADLSADPFSSELIDELGKVIDSYQGRTQEIELINEGEQLRERVKTIGFNSATQLVAIGKK